jgi:hypothetical protein
MPTERTSQGQEEITTRYGSYGNDILWGASSEMPPREVHEGTMFLSDVGDAVVKINLYADG